MMQRILPRALLLALGLSAAAAAHAEGTTAALNAKFGVCFSCHGVDGHAILPNYPNLAGQNKDYLVQTLRQFRDGQRPDPVMSAMAKPLSNSDIDQIAMYYADLKPKK